MKRSNTLTLEAFLLLVLMAAVFFAGFKQSAADNEPGDWSITISGLVDHPYVLTRDAIASMPSSTVDAVVYCVDAPGIPVSEGNWTGVMLETILDKAGLGQGAVKVAFYAGDGYTSDLAISDAQRPDTIIAYQLNGQALKWKGDLPPNKLVLPGRWGYKWVTGIVKIEVVNYDFLGTWERAGYSDQGLINPQAQPATTTTAANPQASQSSGTMLLPIGPVLSGLGMIIVVLLGAGVMLYRSMKRHSNSNSDTRPAVDSA